ncbi:MAG TPA: ABC transporter permease, partial [Desulfosarcina sp.]|nr:ABC transporter permease [Desulfosarcina sp.]
ILGLILIAAVWPLSELPGISGIPLPGYVATFALFAGFSLLSPFFLRFIGRRVSPMLRRAFGEPAHLAGRYLKESGTRVAVSVGSLITAVALFSALVIMIHSFRGTVEIWVTQTVSGDLFVTPRLGEVNRHRNVFPQATADALETMAPDADTVPFRRFYLTYGATAYQFEAIDFAPFLRHGGYLWIAGDPDASRTALVNGDGCIVSEVFANRTGLKPGDRFRDHVAGRVLEIPILGIIRDYRSQGGVVFFSLPRFQAERSAAGLAVQTDEWSGIRYFFKPGAGDTETTVQALITCIIDRFGDQVSHISGRELRRNILRVFDETFAITTVLLIIALIVAALGIATTLAVSVLERSHHLNTIFAVGGSYGQIRSMIFWEASLMVLAGELFGLLCGLILSWLLVFVINRQSFGWTFIYGIDWPSLAYAMPLIFAAALMAALPAVRMVFRHPPATLLRER